LQKVHIDSIVWKYHIWPTSIASSGATEILERDGKTIQKVPWHIALLATQVTTPEQMENATAFAKENGNALEAVLMHLCEDATKIEE